MARITEEKSTKVTSASLLSMLKRAEGKGCGGGENRGDQGSGQGGEQGTEGVAVDRAGDVPAGDQGASAGDRDQGDASSCAVDAAAPVGVRASKPPAAAEADGASTVAATSSRKRRDMTNGDGFDVVNANHEQEQADDGEGVVELEEGQGAQGPRELTAAQRAQAEADIRRYFEDKRAEIEAKEAATAGTTLYAEDGQVAGAGAATAHAAEDSPAFKQAMELVDRIKSDGNEAFRARVFPIAIAKYEEALRLLEQPPLATSTRANHAAVVLRCNRAMALLKLERYADAVAECARVLVMDPRNTKALFRQAQGWKALKKYARAVSNLEVALSIAPEDPEICDLLDECEDLLREQQQGESGAAARAGAQADHISETHDALPSSTPKEIAKDFLNECRMRAANEFLQAGCIQSQALVSHGHSKIGLFRINGAFQSAEAFGQACEFIKRQHVLASAQAVCLIAQKKDIKFPLVWWSGRWPFPLEQDGVFLEIDVRQSKTRQTWFLPAVPGEGPTQRLVLGEPVLLPDTESALLLSSLLEPWHSED